MQPLVFVRVVEYEKRKTVKEVPWKWLFVRVTGCSRGLAALSKLRRSHLGQDGQDQERVLEYAPCSKDALSADASMCRTMAAAAR